MLSDKHIHTALGLLNRSILNRLEIEWEKIRRAHRKTGCIEFYLNFLRLGLTGLENHFTVCRNGNLLFRIEDCFALFLVDVVVLAKVSLVVEKLNLNIRSGSCCNTKLHFH